MSAAIAAGAKSTPTCSPIRRKASCCSAFSMSYETAKTCVNVRSASRSWARCPPEPPSWRNRSDVAHEGRASIRLAAISMANGRCPQIRTISATSAGLVSRPRPSRWEKSAAASSAGSTSRETGRTPGSPGSRRRLVTTTAVGEEPGSSGRICAEEVASSRITSIRRSCATERHRAINSSSSRGSSLLAIPTSRSSSASARGAVGGVRSAVCPPKCIKIRPSGKRSRNRCAKWTAKLDFPTPPIPWIASTVTTSEDPCPSHNAEVSRRSSSRRPAHGTSRGKLSGTRRTGWGDGLSTVPARARGNSASAGVPARIP